LSERLSLTINVRSVAFRKPAAAAEISRAKARRAAQREGNAILGGTLAAAEWVYPGHLAPSRGPVQHRLAAKALLAAIMPQRMPQALAPTRRKRHLLEPPEHGTIKQSQLYI
jgi:hypothetical protein